MAGLCCAPSVCHQLIASSFDALNVMPACSEARSGSAGDPADRGKTSITAEQLTAAQQAVRRAIRGLQHDASKPKARWSSTPCSGLLSQFLSGVNCFPGHITQSSWMLQVALISISARGYCFSHFIC